VKPLFIMLVLFLLETLAQVASAQIGELTDLEGAKKRLDKYLVDADDAMGRRGCLVFRISLVVTSAGSSAEVTQQAETMGLQFYDIDKKIFYSSNHVSKVGSALPHRSEMFRINGKEKGKLYGVGRENANGQVVDIEADRDGKRADWKDSGALAGAHTELDAFSLPVLNSMALEGRLSSIDSAIRMWVTSIDLTSEGVIGNKLMSRWLNRTKDCRSELVFDDSQGGMPVSVMEYTIDTNGKQTKEYLSETKTVWKKVEGNDAKWVPERLESIYSDKSEHRNYTVDLDWVKVEKLDEWVSEIDWKTLFQEPRTNWYGNISRLIFEQWRRENQRPTRK
jgi:hypothetical protein